MHPSSANAKFAKVRNGSTHQNSRPAPTHSHPSHATNTSVAYNAASNLTVPSQPQVPQYNQFDTTQFYSNSGHKTPFYYEVPSGNNFPPTAHTAGPNTQVPYQVPYQHTATAPMLPQSRQEQTMPMVPPHSSGYGYYLPGMVGAQSTEDKVPQPSMDVDDESSSRGLRSPSMDFIYPADPKSAVEGSGSSEDAKKRIRDPHRKEIEGRAAEKRKSAVKRLSHVLAIRTNGLPENGLANQLHMAADQLEEDGRIIAALKKENSDLKKENAVLKRKAESSGGRS